MYLYAGGGEMDVGSGERYDPKTNTWTAIQSMRTPRSLFATVVMDDKIFAIGGFNGKTITRSVEYFDKRTNEWFVYLLL
jgi:N-acetylneuraminic acid mutarotase